MFRDGVEVGGEPIPHLQAPLFFLHNVCRIKHGEVLGSRSERELNRVGDIADACFLGFSEKFHNFKPSLVRESLKGSLNFFRVHILILPFARISRRGDYGLKRLTTFLRTPLRGILLNFWSMNFLSAPSLANLSFRELKTGPGGGFFAINLWLNFYASILHPLIYFLATILPFARISRGELWY